MSTTATETMGGASHEYHVMSEDHPPNTVQLGFWTYLMSDCFIFISLFVAYAVFAFGGHYAEGPRPQDILEIGMIAVSTGALLLSSLTYGFGMLAMDNMRKGPVLSWMAVAGSFALVFLGLEIYEFVHLIEHGAGPSRSAFLSSFFTLVGTHGLHVTMGIIWMTTLMYQVIQNGLTSTNKRRLTCLSIYWHFLDLVWIGIFSFVYLIGVLP